MPLTLDDVKAFLDAKLAEKGRADLICPVCGHDEWAAGPRDSLFASVPTGQMTEAGVHSVSKYLPVVWLRCSHCSHILFFGMRAIERWREERADEREADATDHIG